MATVRMSDNLISNISYRAEKVAQNTFADPTADFSTTDWADKVYAEYVQLPSVVAYTAMMHGGQTNNHLAQAAWDHTEVLTTVTVGDKSTGYTSTRMSQERTFPAMAVSYSGAKIMLSDEEATPELRNLMKEFESHIAKRTQYRADIDGFVKGITNAVRQFNTLNQALKHIPMLDKLVSEEVLAKVRQKAKPRVAKPKEEVELDTSHAAACIARARLMGKI